MRRSAAKAVPGLQRALALYPLLGITALVFHAAWIRAQLRARVWASLGRAARRADRGLPRAHRGAAERGGAGVIARLLAQLGADRGIDSARDLPVMPPQVLHAVRRRNPDGSPAAVIAPETPLLDTTLFTMIVTMAVLTTMAMPPMLRVALRGLPMSAEEEVRITRESI